MRERPGGKWRERGGGIGIGMGQGGYRAAILYSIIYLYSILDCGADLHCLGYLFACLAAEGALLENVLQRQVERAQLVPGIFSAVCILRRVEHLNGPAAELLRGPVFARRDEQGDAEQLLVTEEGGLRLRPACRSRLPPSSSFVTCGQHLCFVSTLWLI